MTYDEIHPKFDNPYPDEDWEKLEFVDYDTPLVLYRGIESVKRRRGEDADYILAKDYTVSYRLDGVQKYLTVPRGMVTDLSSVPRGLRNIVGRVGPHLEASIFHDFLYIAWQIMDRGPHKADQVFSDKLMCAALHKANVNPIQIFLICLALRTFGGFVYRGRDNKPFFVDIGPL